jgi:hypothetical protein
MALLHFRLMDAIFNSSLVHTSGSFHSADSMHTSVTWLLDLDHVGVVFGISPLSSLGAEMSHSRSVPSSRGARRHLQLIFTMVCAKKSQHFTDVKTHARDVSKGMPCFQNSRPTEKGLFQLQLLMAKTTTTWRCRLPCYHVMQCRTLYSSGRVWRGRKVK